MIPSSNMVLYVIGGITERLVTETRDQQTRDFPLPRASFHFTQRLIISFENTVYSVKRVVEDISFIVNPVHSETCQETINLMPYR